MSKKTIWLGAGIPEAFNILRTQIMELISDGHTIIYSGHPSLDGMESILKWIQENDLGNECFKLFNCPALYSKSSSDYSRLMDKYYDSVSFEVIRPESTPEDVADQLTYMREQIAEMSDIYIAIGGKYKEYMGKCPGILEEAGLMAKAAKKVITILVNIPSVSTFLHPITLGSLPTELLLHGLDEGTVYNNTMVYALHDGFMEDPTRLIAVNDLADLTKAVERASIEQIIVDEEEKSE